LFAYDKVGRKTKLARESSLEQRYYDARGQLISVVDKYMGKIDYSYDLVGNLVQMIDPLGRSIPTASTRPTGLSSSLIRKAAIPVTNTMRWEE